MPSRWKGKGGLTKKEIPPLKIRLRGKDNAGLTMQQMVEGLLEAARTLKQYENGYRAKSATVYLTLIDKHGMPVHINEANELVIFPYRTAAEENGV